MTRPVCSTCGHTLTECQDVSGYYCEMCVHGRIRSCKEHCTVFTGHDEECYRCLRNERDKLQARIDLALSIINDGGFDWLAEHSCKQKHSDHVMSVRATEMSLWAALTGVNE